MRQQSRAIENQLAHRGEIVERACKTLFLQKVARFGKNSLGLIAEREQSFFATGAAALLRYGKNFVRCHEMRAGLAWVFAERAVTAVVATERGERDEDFFREGDRAALLFCAEDARGRQQFA